MTTFKYLINWYKLPTLPPLYGSGGVGMFKCAL